MRKWQWTISHAKSHDRTQAVQSHAPQTRRHINDCFKLQQQIKTLTRLCARLPQGCGLRASKEDEESMINEDVSHTCR
jgi:hypothetical protein